MKSTAKAPPAAVLNLLKANPGRAFEATELADHFECSHTAVGVSVRGLVATGDIQCSQGPRKINLFHFGPRIQSSPVKSTKYVGQVVSPFRADNWKPAMSGYERQLRARADLAMAGRA